MLLLALALLAPLQGNEPRFENWPDGTLKASYEVRVGEDGEELRHGPFRSWYASGALESEGQYANGKRDGKWTLRWENGKRRATGPYANDLRAGRWQHFDEAGKKTGQGNYRVGRRDGPWKYWVDGVLDATRSGTFTWHSRSVGGSGVAWEGEVRDGLKDGPWSLRRADGSPLFVGRYGPAGAEGPWVLLHADGSIDPTWASGHYVAGRRSGPLQGLPEDFELPDPDRPSDPRRAAPLECDPDALAALDLYLASEPGVRLAPKRALLADRAAAVRAVVARLQTLDLASPEGDALARRLNEELLRELFGATFAWLPLAEQGALEVNLRTALRWRTFLELVDLEEPVWQRLLDPDWRWIPFELERTPLASPPMPAGFESRTVDASATGTRPVPLLYRGRTTTERGETGTEEAVGRALDWLVRTQSESGEWEAGTNREVEATAFALLALLGSGELPTAGERRESVARGLAWTVKLLRPRTGQLRSTLSYDVRSHALALMALAEASTLTGLPAVLEAAHRARECLIAARHPDGSWPRDWARGPGDTLTTIYAWFALKTLEDSPVGCPREPLDLALAWLDGQTGADGATAPDRDGRQPAVTAWTALCRIFAGRSPHEDRELALQIEWMVDHPSSTTLGDMLLDSEYVCLGAHAMFQVGGEAWKNWNATMKMQLLQVQQRKGDEEGSWLPADVGPPDFTTVTALRALTFQSYYRFGKLVE